MNKEKIIEELRNNIYLGKIDTCCAGNLLKIIQKIENGEIDDEKRINYLIKKAN